MLFCMLRSARSTQADYVLKIDCDTCLLSLDHILADIRRAPDAIIGYRVSRIENYISGGAYTIPARALYDLILALQDYSSPDGNMPEDRTINHLCRACGVPEIIHDHVFAPSSSWHTAPFKYLELPARVLEDAEPVLPYNLLNRYLIYSSVNFGNRHELQTLDSPPQDPHSVAGKMMRSVLDFAIPRLARN